MLGALSCLHPHLALPPPTRDHNHLTPNNKAVCLVLTHEVEVRGAVESMEDVVGEEGRRREVCPAETVAQQEVGQDGRRQPGHRGKGSKTLTPPPLLQPPPSGDRDQHTTGDQRSHHQRTDQTLTFLLPGQVSVVGFFGYGWCLRILFLYFFLVGGVTATGLCVWLPVGCRDWWVSATLTTHNLIFFKGHIT